MQFTKFPIKDIAKKLGKGAKDFSGEFKSKVPLYIGLFKVLAAIGKNISLNVDIGHIRIKEDIINTYLKDVSADDKGLKSIRISCKHNNTSFFIELKKFLFEGVIELPFTVENFILSKEQRTVTIKFGDKKLSGVKNYYSKIAFWFVSSILSIFNRKGNVLKNRLFSQEIVQNNSDGSFTIDLNEIPELKELFKKNVASVKYWDLIAIDRLWFEDGLVVLKLSEKNATVLRTSFGLIEVLPVGRIIRPLVNRF